MRILHHGQKLSSEGKFDQALKEFQTLAASFAQSDIADEAFFEIANCWIQKEQFNWAVDNLQTIVSEYPSSNTAPEASFLLGELYEKRSFEAEFSLAEAYGNYARVFDVYPSSPLADVSLLRAGRALALQGEWLSSAPLFRRILFHYPGSQYAPQAWLLLGQSLAVTGHPIDAMKSIQASRLAEGKETERIRRISEGWNTQLFRYQVVPRRMLFQSAPLQLSPQPERIEAFAFDREGRLLVMDNGKEALLIYSQEGKEEGLHALPEKGKDLCADPLGGWLVACESCVVRDGRIIKYQPIETDRYADPKDLNGIELIALHPEGQLFLGVHRERGLYRGYSQQTVVSPNFPSKNTSKVADVKVDRFGQVCLLLEKGQGLLVRVKLTGEVVDEVDGDALGTRGLDVLDVGPLGNFYLLDMKQQKVLILGPTLSLIAKINLSDHGIQRGVDLAVSPAGLLHVLDGKSERVFCFE